jgi:hypothetical protein
MGGPVEIREWRAWSPHHIQAACLFSRQAREVEVSYDPSLYGELHVKQNAYVTGAILASVAFLEATINEFLAGAADSKHGVARELPPSLTALLGDLWKPPLPRMPIQEKFQRALTVARKKPFDKGAQPYQDVHLLIDLRNQLVHYVPRVAITYSAIDPSAVVQHKIAGKFAPNPLFPSDVASLDKYLGHGCARWAALCSLAFADEFYRRIRVTPRYEHQRPELRTE